MKMFKKKKALLVGQAPGRHPTRDQSFRNSLFFSTVYRLLCEICHLVRILVVVDLSLDLLKGLDSIGNVLE